MSERVKAQVLDVNVVEVFWFLKIKFSEISLNEPCNLIVS